MNNYNNAYLNVNNNRPLISREQNYYLERKLLTIHSEDRDIDKYPKSNEFSIKLPDTIRNIQSMRLVQCEFPINFYNFSNYNQNTKISLYIIPNDPSDNYFNILNDNSNNYYTITIHDGTYNSFELAIELENKLNDIISKYILDNSGGTTISKYTNMKVIYDNVSQKYWFGNMKDSFSLLFNKKENYNINCINNKELFNKYFNWGLPYNLGFNKEIYHSKKSFTPINFSYLLNPVWISPTSSSLPIYYVQSPLIHNIIGNNTIYMEINNYNNYDELVPYNGNTSSSSISFNNDFNGKVNSAFAKIPITNIPYGISIDSRNGFLLNVKTFVPPKERISSLDIKFRYHDGRLVDFNNSPFNLTIEFNTLRDEINKNYKVRVPDLYLL